AAYGLEVQVGKTIYVDGIQLEEKAYATSYADGSLQSASGGGYAWTSTANNSTSTRTVTTTEYSSSSNIGTTTGTISFWLNTKNQGVYGNMGSTAWTTYFSTNGTKRLAIYRRADNNGGNQIKIVAGDWTGQYNVSSLAADSWHHFVFYWNSSDNTKVFYENNSVASADYDSGTVVALSGVSTIGLGKDTAGTYQQADALVSDVRVYDSILTSNEISDLYNAGLVSRSDSASTIVVDRFDNTKGQSPIAVWHMDEGQGTSANDSTTYLNHLAVSGATWQVNSADNGAPIRFLKFDGTNDYLSRSFDMDFNVGTDPFTVSGLFKHPSTVSGTDTIFARYGTAGYKIYMNSSGYVCFGIDDDSTWTPDDSACSTVSYADSKWRGFSAVRDTGAIMLYIDGIEVATDGVLATTGSLSTNSTLYVGIDSDGTSNPWDGFLDEFMVYPYARNAGQVKTDNLGGQIGTLVGTHNTDNLTDGLLYWWKLNESAGGTAVDSSGNGNNGTYTDGATNAAGKFGNGGSFDGDNDFIEITDYLPNYSSFSVSGWFNLSSTVSGSADYFPVFGNNQNESFLGYSPSNYRFVHMRQYIGGSQNIFWNTSTNLADSSWHFVSMIVDQSNYKISLYVDGTLNSTQNIGIQGYTHSNGALTKIGRDYGTSWKGVLDELRVYNRAITPAEVTQLYEWAPGPVAEWKMDEGTGQYAQDTSGNGNNGTLGTGATGDSADPTWTTGKYGKGLKFDGSDDYVDASDLTGNELGSQYTVTGWATVNDSNVRVLLSFGKDILAQAGLSDFRWQTNDSGDTAVKCSTTRSTGVWYHYAVVSTGTAAGQTKFYLNGQSCGDDGDIVALSSGALNIGRESNPVSRYWNGAIDNIRIYNYARSQKQIVQDMISSGQTVTAGGDPAAGSAKPAAPVAYYKFDEGQGITANNSGNGGSSLNGTLTSMSSPATATSGWTNSGKYGKALNFDGSNDGITTTATQVSGTDDFTLSAWIKRGRSSINDFDVLGGNYGTGSCTTGLQWSIYQGKPSVYLGSFSSGNSTIPLNTWYHIVATRKTGTVTFYINGVSDGSVSKATSIGSNCNWAIGIGANYTSEQFNGTLDEVKIYNYALSAEEVKTDYNAGSAMKLGSLSTNSSNTPSNASLDSYCPPGQGTTCVGPVAEWKMDEGTGTSVKDTSGNENTGTASGTSWIHGVQGKAIDFVPGSDGMISAGSGSSLNETNGLTISTWVYQDAYTESYPTLYSKGPQSYAGVGYNWVYTANDGSILYQYAVAPATVKAVSLSCGTSLGVWQHISIIHDRANKTLYCYVNGVKKDTKTYTDTAVTVTTGNAYIGTYDGSTANQYHFDGKLDDYKIYNYARTPAQIAWDYNHGAPVAHWKFDESSGAVASDASGNSQTGTVTAGSFITGIRNNALSFNGTSSFVSATVSKSINAISFWMQQANTSNKSIIDLDGGTHTITVSSNAISANGFSVPTVYVDGKATTAITDTNWHYVTVTSATAFTASTVTLGKVSSAFYTGTLDDVKLFTYPLTLAQVKVLYNDGAVAFRPNTSTAGNISYLLNDQFTTARAAGAVNGTAAEPGPGTRTVVDTGNKLNITGGKYNVITGGNNYGDPGLWYGEVNRASGLIYLGEITPQSDTLPVPAFGFDTNTSGSLGSNSIRFYSTLLQARDTAANPTVGSISFGTTYSLALSLRSSGAYYFIKGGTFTNWTLIWISPLSSTTTLYPYIGNDSSTTSIFTADNIRIPTATWLPTPLAYDSFGATYPTQTEIVGPDGVSGPAVPQLTWTGGAKSGGKMVITPSLGSESVTNGDMETGDPPTGWTPSGDTVVDAVSDERTGGSGGQSIAIGPKIVTNPVVNRGSLAMSPSTWYQWSGWAKETPGSYGGGYQILDQNYATFVNIHAFTTSWANYIGSFRSLSTSTSGRIYLYGDQYGNPLGTIYYDDISYKPLTLSSLFSTVPTSDTDVIASADVTMTAGTQAGIVTNLDSTSSPANFLIAYHDGSKIWLDKNVGGTYTNLISATTTYSAGATLRVITYHSDASTLKVRVYYNNALIGSEQTVTDGGVNGIINNTKHGLFSTYSGNTFDNFTLFPRGTGNEYSTLDNY
ncbi:MAG: hypothetical protein ACD_22C00280G0001, partial [uncultured bacterium]